MALSTFQKVNIGDLRTPIELQKFEHSVDEYGFNKPIWTTYATPRVKVEFDDRLIRQVIRDEGVDTTTVRIFTMRYIPNITTKDRIVYKNTEFEIYATQNLGERDRFIKLWGRQIEPTN